MFRNLYDSDVTTISPQGRLFQLEYAMEAVKQGAAVVGITGGKHVVLTALKRSGGELATYQKKIVQIDDHIGVALAGLTSDAKVLSKYMQSQALASRTNMNRAIPVQRLVADISDKAQNMTQEYGGRPFGVGLLIAGYDGTGPHLFEFSPSGVFSEYYAMAIGARSSSARTYLEKCIPLLTDNNSVDSVTLSKLLEHALRALRDTLPPDASPGLTAQNTAIGILGPMDVESEDGQVIVGGKVMFRMIEDEKEIQALLDSLPPLTQRSSNTEASTTSTVGRQEGEVSTTDTTAATEIPEAEAGGTTNMQVD